MQVSYVPWLVLLSIVMAVQGAYVGLSLAVQIGGTGGLRRRLLLAAAAVSLAGAIWTMHFIGMLAAILPFPVDYLVFPTLLSFLVCVLVVGIGVYAAGAGPLAPVRLALSSSLMGVGIFTMHYIGMSALHASARMVNDPVFVAGSLAIAIAASGLALWLAAGRGKQPPMVLSAIVFGIAVSGMHYTAMAGMTLFPLPGADSSAPALSTDLLAIVVAVVAFCASGIFLLFLVPDLGRTEPVAAPPLSNGLAAATGFPAASPQVAMSGAAAVGDGAEYGRGTYAPLGGLGGPRPRIARHLPVEHDGATRYIAVEDVVAIHANAHYTTIFDGHAKLFCPLAIGDLESRLDRDRFIRVHRSHIVNIERVTGHRRAGDGELVEMAAAGRYTVPVSRSRIAMIKARIGAKNGAVTNDRAAAFRTAK
jgi:NO-binding membrane sensor protein with MHYT domain